MRELIVGFEPPRTPFLRTVNSQNLQQTRWAARLLRDAEHSYGTPIAGLICRASQNRREESPMSHRARKTR